MSEQVETLDHEQFGVSPERGFLPDIDPLASLETAGHPRLRRLETAGDDLSNLLERDRLGPTVRNLEAPPPGAFDDLSRRELHRVYTVAGLLANAYVHRNDAPTVDAIPAGVAVPLYEATDRLGRTPVLSYDAYVLHNWTREDTNGGTSPPNVAPLARFFDVQDERWFVAVHVAIESAAGPAVGAIGDAQQGVRDDDEERVREALGTIADALDDVTRILDRMPERNDPEAYGQGVRPYLGSISGVRYDGVDALDGSQSFRGASGAQSSIFPALDAALGVDHGDNPLVDHLLELRRDMPPGHRAFVEAADRGPDVRDFAATAGDDLREAYDDCIDRMVTFREHHVDVVETYLVGQVDEQEGTGGTPFGRYLTSFIDDTREAGLSGFAG
ncbi:PrnB family protein [Halomicrococcus gelatinilyticus]|uniref:hypothetical protein n=1 Tax=Halomicrococcus gelatinilyticus TaxID=1702103 RepID=UPI002E155E3E